MNMPISVILDEFRDRLQGLYGEQLERLILFGSRARGDGDAESDIDVLVVLKGPIDRRSERERTIDIVAGLSLEYDIVITPVFTDAET